MDQGWKKLLLLVVFLQFWKNAPGFAYSTYPNAGQWWGQPSDNAFLPLVVQSSVPEAPVTEVLLEEVVSRLPKNNPKFNLLQVVKGGVSSSSDSTPQALPPNTPSSATQSVDQSGMSGVVSLQGSSGSTTTSGSGQIVFAQGGSGGFASKTAVSGQSTNDQSSPGLSSSVSQSTTYGVTTQGTSPFAPGSSSPYATISLPKYVTSQLTAGPSSKQVTSVYGTQTGSSAPFTLQASTTYDGRIQTPDTTSPLVLGSSTPYVAVSLPQVTSQLTPAPSTKQVTSVYTTQTGSSAPFTLQELLQGQDSTSHVVYESSTPYVSVSLPQVVTSSLTPVPSSKQVTSVYGTPSGSSAPFTLQRLLQGKGPTSQVVSVPSTPYVAVSMPKVVTSQLTPVPSSKQVTSVYTTQTGSPAPFTLQELLQGKVSTSQVVSVPSTPYVTVSTPQVVTSQLTPVPSSKQVTTVYTTQTGSPAPFTLQELLEGQDQTSQVVYGSSTPYISVSLPQVVASQLTSVPSSKQITSVYGTQTGSFAPLTLQESTTYDGLIQTVDTTDQLVSGSTPYVAVSMPKVVASQLTPVPNSKQVTSVYGTMTGSSAPFTLQKLLQGKGSTSQVISVPSTPYVAVSLPQSVTSQSMTVPSSKPVTSVYTTQTGSSAPFTLQELLQGQDSTSQVVYESSTPYVYLSSPQVVTSQLTPVPGSKQVTPVYTTQTGSSVPFTLQGLLQGQDSTSQVVYGSSFPYVFVSTPQVVTSQLTPVPSSKQVTTVYGTQTDSSAPFTLQKLLQGKGSTSQVVSEPSTPYVSVSLPQVVTSQTYKVPSSKQVTSVYTTQTGSSAPFSLQELLQGQDSTRQVVYESSTPYVYLSSPQVVTSQSAVPSLKKITAVYDSQTGSSAPFTLQGSTTYGELIQPQNAKDASSTGSSSAVLQTSTGDSSNPSSSFSTLKRYYSVKD